MDFFTPSHRGRERRFDSFHSQRATRNPKLATRQPVTSSSQPATCNPQLLSSSFHLCALRGKPACNPSVTGGPEQTLLGPGGSGGTCRKHRPGQAGNQAPSSVSAKGGGRPWPPPPPRRNQRSWFPAGRPGPPGPGSSRPNVPPPFLTTAQP